MHSQINKYVRLYQSKMGFIKSERKLNVYKLLSIMISKENVSDIPFPGFLGNQKMSFKSPSCASKLGLKILIAEIKSIEYMFLK